MRITGGQYRGRKLDTPKNDDIRPTSDKVRQAMFNMLNARGLVQDAVVIDAFCGTGALGIEALSQGARHGIFFDKHRTSYNLAKANIESLDIQNFNLFCQDITKCHQRPDDISVADLVFLDPPYKKDLIPQAIENLKNKNWLSDDVTFVMEMDKTETVSSPLISIIHEKIYGDTKVLLGQLA